MTLLRTFRYLNEVHSANLEGNVEIKLCDSASLKDKKSQLYPLHRGSTGHAYLSSSFLIISTTSSGNFWICLWLKSIVTPGFSSLLTPLASAPFVWFSSRAFFIASWARATTCAAEVGICDASEEFDAACRTVVLFGILRTVFRGGGLGRPLLSSDRPLD